MKKALITLGLVLAAGCEVRAQEAVVVTVPNDVPAVKSETTLPVNPSPEGIAERGGIPAAENASPATALPAVPAPAASPKNIIFGDRDDYRWQLGLGVEFFRFQSNIYSASMVGTNTTLSYFTNSWFAVEGMAITGFAPTIYQQEHVKMFGGGGGFRIGGRRARFEPFGHALIGGDHILPQTAGNSKNGLMAQAGIGVDYRVHARLSLRVETDWVYTGFFGQSQNNFQAIGGVVLHF